MDGNRITTREAAKLLGVAQRSIVRYIAQGSLPAQRVWEPDGPYLVDRADIDALRPSVEKARDRHRKGLAKVST